MPDSDISGLGVILAFTISAYITFALVLAAYLLGQVDESLLNTVDTKIFHIRPFRPPRTRDGKPTRLRVSLALRQAILSLSDQQIVTGIAILGAGFQGLRLGGIDSYHYQIVIYLAWMSSSVHLSALSILAPLLKDRPALKTWRLTGMLVLMIMLAIALIPTAGNDWGLITWKDMLPGNSGWGVPAICFWGTTYGDGVNPDAVLGFVILFVSYVWKVGGLFDGACWSYQRWIRYPVEWGFEKLLTGTAKRYASSRTQSGKGGMGWLLNHRLVVAVWVPYVAVFETLASFSTAIWISCLGLVFGTIQIAVPRHQNQPFLEANENVWGFGQLVPLILLIQPFSVVWEHLIVSPRKHSEAEPEHTSTSTASDKITPMNMEVPRPQQLQYSRSLLHHLTSHKPVKPSARVRFQPTPTEQILFESFLFRINVYLIQPAIITASVLAFMTDAWYIGYSTTGNWTYFCIIFGVYVGAAWLLTFCLLPWVPLGKEPRVWQATCTTSTSSEAESNIELYGDHALP